MNRKICKISMILIVSIAILGMPSKDGRMSDSDETKVVYNEIQKQEASVEHNSPVINNTVDQIESSIYNELHCV